MKLLEKFYCPVSGILLETKESEINDFDAFMIKMEMEEEDIEHSSEDSISIKLTANDFAQEVKDKYPENSFLIIGLDKTPFKRMGALVGDGPILAVTPEQHIEERKKFIASVGHDESEPEVQDYLDSQREAVYMFCDLVSENPDKEGFYEVVARHGVSKDQVKVYTA